MATQDTLTKPCSVCGVAATEHVDGFSLCSEHAKAVQSGRRVAELKGELQGQGKPIAPGDVQGNLVPTHGTTAPATGNRPAGATPGADHLGGVNVDGNEPFRTSPSTVPEGIPRDPKATPQVETKTEKRR